MMETQEQERIDNFLEALEYNARNCYPAEWHACTEARNRNTEKMPKFKKGATQSERKKKEKELASIEAVEKINDLNGVSDEKHFISVTVDSGAGDNVTNKDEAPEYEVETSDHPEKDTAYILPDGRVIRNEGVKNVKVITEEGAKCTVKMQVTDVRKSLMSVSRVCDEGHRVVFEKHGGYIEHLATGQKTQFPRIGGVYVLRLEVAPKSGFPRQGNR